MIYKITKENSDNVIYLFGSMHISKKDTYPLSDTVMKAYSDSDFLACEFDLTLYKDDMEKSMELLSKLVYTDGTTIKDHISNELYDKLVKYLKENYFYNEKFDYYKPYFFNSIITEFMYNKAKFTETGIDEYFLNKAKKDKKEILEVESYDYQMDLLLSFSDDYYAMELESLLEDEKKSLDSLEELYEAWKNGDVNKILKSNEIDEEDLEEYTEEELSMMEDCNNKILTVRNKNMTDKLIQYFEDDKDVFFMVGALHLVGDDGICSLLKDKGYKVELLK